MPDAGWLASTGCAGRRERGRASRPSACVWRQATTAPRPGTRTREGTSARAVLPSPSSASPARCHRVPSHEARWTCCTPSAGLEVHVTQGRPASSRRRIGVVGLVPHASVEASATALQLPASASHRWTCTFVSTSGTCSMKPTTGCPRASRTSEGCKAFVTSLVVGNAVRGGPTGIHRGPPSHRQT